MASKSLNRLLLVFSVHLAACGGAGSPGPSSQSGSGGSAGGPNTDSGSSTSVTISSVSGRVVDEKGNAIASALVSVCGTECYNGKTDDSGLYTVPMGVMIDLETFGILPHVDYPLARVYVPLPVGSSGAVQAPDLHVLALPDGPPLIVKTDSDAAPAQAVTSGDVALSIEAGTLLALDFDDVLVGDEGKKFRAVKVPADHIGHYAKPELGLRALYAMGPFNVALQSKAAGGAPPLARLTVKNTLGLSAHQAVEFLALELTTGKGKKPGSFSSAATGMVSADGASIEMDPNQGLGRLTWFGIR